jgi:hypothetical protein
MRKAAGLLAVVTTLLAGCALRPPRISLEPLATVGLVGVRSSAEGGIGDYATQVFLEILTESQPGVRIKELGPAEAMLGEPGADRMTPDAAADIGQKYGVAAVFFGTLQVSDVRPRINIATIITSATVSADVEAVLSARLVDTRDGATLWAAGARDRKAVGHVSYFQGGGIFFDARDPEEAYGDLVRSLVSKVTRDLRWRRTLW